MACKPWSRPPERRSAGVWLPRLTRISGFRPSLGLAPGSARVAVHALCRALAARGHTVEVFTTSIDGPRNAPVPHGKPVMLDGVKIHYFASPVMRRLSWAPPLARALRREIAGADVAHLHSVFLWPTWAAARLARGAQVPYGISP